MHKPFVITKELDKSSPLLYNVLIQNKTLVEWELQCFAPQLKAVAGAGVKVNNHTLKLWDVHVMDIKSIMLNNKDAKLASRSMYEEISFTYAKIEWTWMDGGITAMDDIGMGAGVKCFFFTAISNKCVILLIAISITQLIFEYFLTFFNKY